MDWLVFGLVLLALFVYVAWPPQGSKSGPAGKRREARPIFRWRDGHWAPVGWQYSTGRKLYLPSSTMPAPLD